MEKRTNICVFDGNLSFPYHIWKRGLEGRRADTRTENST
jgi:hypothetical protein